MPSILLAVKDTKHMQLYHEERDEGEDDTESTDCISIKFPIYM